MTIIIDGYNVLKPLAQSSDVSDFRRTHFIDQVAVYAHSSKNNVTIVFDGGTHAFPTRFKQNGLTVIYSGYKDTADDVIKKQLVNVRADNAVVVSTDRDICAYADRLKIATIDSHVFYGYMRDSCEHKSVGRTKRVGSLQKRKGHKSDAEIDALMEEASSMMILQSDDLEYVNKEQHQAHKKKKLSKAERRLKKIVKKL